MRFNDLQAWLDWQETLHPSSIDLGLERVAAVWSRMCPEGVEFAIITVAGTNGKGSCAAMLESIYRAAGYRTACYSSPHLLRYNERIRLDGAEVSDEALCAAFERVDEARGGSTLTYFEFGTLAALDLFNRFQPDVAVLEVGLGGRLDAVNILDPDVALVTTIGLDHTAWLGETLDEIAIEKAGIFRPGRPAVVGHRLPSRALTERAQRLGCNLYVLGRDYDWKGGGPTWCWTGPGFPAELLPAPSLRGAFQRDNAAAVLMAVSCLNRRLNLHLDDLRRGLRQVGLGGRFQVIPGEVTWVLDVAHNAQAAEVLAENLRNFDCPGRLHAVLGVLRDKDPKAIAEPLAGLVERWYLGRTMDSRALPANDLAAALEDVAARSDMSLHERIHDALSAVAAQASPGDCILVFGSFSTVEAALLRAHGEATAI